MQGETVKDGTGGWQPGPGRTAAADTGDDVTSGSLSYGLHWEACTQSMFAA